jgi:hypothetical protein
MENISQAGNMVVAIFSFDQSCPLQSYKVSGYLSGRDRGI